MLVFFKVLRPSGSPFIYLLTYLLMYLLTYLLNYSIEQIPS